MVKTALRGYHVSQAVWEPHVGEAFIAMQESSKVGRGYSDSGVIPTNYTLTACCSRKTRLSKLSLVPQGRQTLYRL